MKTPSWYCQLNETDRVQMDIILDTIEEICVEIGLSSNMSLEEFRSYLWILMNQTKSTQSTSFDEEKEEHSGKYQELYTYLEKNGMLYFPSSSIQDFIQRVF